MLASNRSLKVLNLNSCLIGPKFVKVLSEGIEKNNGLQTLLLEENNFLDPKCIQTLCKALMEQKQTTLHELDIARCGLLDEHLGPLCELFQAKFKLRRVDLSSNGIQDKGAQALIQAVQLNPYLVKLKLDANPCRKYLSREIDKICDMNLQKKGSQEIPQHLQSIKDYSKLRAESLLDCAFEPQLLEEI